MMAHISYMRFFGVVLLVTIHTEFCNSYSLGKAIECMDSKPTKLCERRKAKGKCESNPRWACKNCKYTCELCMDPTCKIT